MRVNEPLSAAVCANPLRRPESSQHRAASAARPLGVSEEVGHVGALIALGLAEHADLGLPPSRVRVVLVPLQVKVLRSTRTRLTGARAEGGG